MTALVRGDFWGNRVESGHRKSTHWEIVIFKEAVQSAKSES
jgi:hypothetical protein